MKKAFKFYAIDRAFGEETEIDADAIKLVCSDGQEIELSAYLLSGVIKLESKGNLQVRPDTMSSVIIEDKPCADTGSGLSSVDKKYCIAQELMKTKYDCNLDDYVSEEFYKERFSGIEPHKVVEKIAREDGLRRKMPRLEHLFPVKGLDELTIYANNK